MDYKDYEERFFEALKEELAGGYAIDDSTGDVGIEEMVIKRYFPEIEDRVEAAEYLKERMNGRGFGCVYKDLEKDHFFIGWMDRKYRPAYENGQLLYVEEV